jgi:hypothetical protein
MAEVSPQLSLLGEVEPAESKLAVNDRS